MFIVGRIIELQRSKSVRMMGCGEIPAWSARRLWLIGRKKQFVEEEA
jgi:hypothetical protein